jgi:hypothetical protein
MVSSCRATTLPRRLVPPYAATEATSARHEETLVVLARCLTHPEQDTIPNNHSCKLCAKTPHFSGLTQKIAEKNTRKRFPCVFCNLSPSRHVHYIGVDGFSPPKRSLQRTGFLAGFLCGHIKKT